MDFLPGRYIIGVALEAVAEVAGVETAQRGGDPRREVHAVGHVADVEFVLEVARPHVAQNVFRHLAVEPRHAVDFLRKVAGQNGHRELLVGVVGIGLAEVDVLLPRDAQHIGVVRHVLADHLLGECVVTCGHGGVRREERRRADDFERFGERQLLVVHHLADAFDADERGVTLVAVEHLVLDTQFAQGPDAADAQQNLLLEAVLPVAAVEVVGDLTVFFEVVLEIGVQQEQVGASYLAFPDARRKRAAREGDGDGEPVALLVAHGRNGQLVEVLCFIGRFLCALRRETLGEVAVAVQQTHGSAEGPVIWLEN